MRRLLPAFVLLMSVVSAFSQSAENRYNSRRTSDGVLFFIMPERLKALSGLKKFEYDITLLSWTDSATVNFTIESTSMLVPTDLRIISDCKTVECSDYAPLYIDIKKNHYEIRTTSKWSNTEIETIINSDTPPRFSFNQGNEPKCATYKPKAWIKDRKKLHDIIQLYLYSR